MCHHYPGAKKRDIEELIKWTQMSFEFLNDFEPLFGIDYYQSNTVPALRLEDDGEWILEKRQWGFVTKNWRPTQDCKTVKAFQRKRYNAQSERIADAWTWRRAFHQRCVLLAGGFYENTVGGEYLFTLRDRPAFYIPALWESFQGDNGKGEIVEIESCVMLTCEANELVLSNRTGRKRQPVIFTDEEQVRHYCSPDITELTQYDELKQLFDPHPSDDMEMEFVERQPR